jgi:hypothetical protein
MFSVDRPGALVDVCDVFGFDCDLKVLAFDEVDEHVPDVDPAYRFDRDVTLAILSGFVHNRRVLVQGPTARESRRTSSRLPLVSIGPLALAVGGASSDGNLVITVDRYCVSALDH